MGIEGTYLSFWNLLKKSLMNERFVILNPKKKLFKMKVYIPVMEDVEISLVIEFSKSIVKKNKRMFSNEL